MMKFILETCHDDLIRYHYYPHHHSQKYCLLNVKNSQYCITECNHRGKCYKAGYILKEGCYRRQCKVDTERRIAYMDIIDGGNTKMHTTD